MAGKRRVEELEENVHHRDSGELQPDPSAKPGSIEDPETRAVLGGEAGAVAEPDHGEKRGAEEDPTVDQEHQSKRSRIEMLDLYLAKVNALQQTRQRKEVQIASLCKFNQECFRKAMLKEVQNNIKTGASEPMSQEESASIRQTSPEKVLESRYPDMSFYTKTPRNEHFNTIAPWRGNFEDPDGNEISKKKKRQEG